MRWSIFWLLASVVPLLFLARLLAVTLYSMPASDDYCLAYLNNVDGFLRATEIWYRTAVGRIVPLILIQLPAALGRVMGLDYFITYVAVLIGIQLCLIAATLLFARRLWSQASFPQIIFVGTAMSAVALSNVPELRELLYWLPGTACYAVPAAIVLPVFAVFICSAESRSRITPIEAGMLSVGCFVAALCNEFTPVWMLGLILGSVIYRAAFWRDEVQWGVHAVIGASTLAGLAILLLAPGNSVRMGMFPTSGDLGRSVGEAFNYFVTTVKIFARDGRTAVWIIIVLVFTALQPPPARKGGRERLLLAMLALMFALGCTYLAFFTAEYAMGGPPPPRAQNETTFLLGAGITISAALLVRALQSRGLSGLMAFPSKARLAGEAVVAVALGAALIVPLSNSATMRLLRSEQVSFRTFWLEGMARHAQLSLAKEDSFVLAALTVLPTVLSAGEIGELPDRLPNDCIARFYGKKAVVVKPTVKAGTPAEVLALLPKLISGIRSRNGSIQTGLMTPSQLALLNIDVPALLVAGQNFSSPWGQIVMTRLTNRTTLDFRSVPPDICRELLGEGSRIEGVVGGAGSSRAADERPAPLSPDVAKDACVGEEAMARLIIENGEQPRPAR
jgi:hypothetical protein